MSDREANHKDGRFSGLHSACCQTWVVPAAVVGADAAGAAGRGCGGRLWMPGHVRCRGCMLAGRCCR